MATIDQSPARARGSELPAAAPSQPPRAAQIVVRSALVARSAAVRARCESGQAARASATSSTTPDPLDCSPGRARSRMPATVCARRGTCGRALVTSGLQRDDVALLRRSRAPPRSRAASRRPPRAAPEARLRGDGSPGEPRGSDRPLQLLVERHVAARLGLDRLARPPRSRAAPSLAAAPAEAGVARAARPRAAPPPARRGPTSRTRRATRARGSAARPAPPSASPTGASARPTRCSSATKTSSSTSRARPQRPHLRVHARGRPEQHERLVDQVRAEVEQQAARVLRRRRPRATAPSRTSGRQRSKRDSSRQQLAQRALVRASRRRVRKSPSQRRLWNTLATTPALGGRRRQPLGRPPRSPPAACPPPRAARPRAPPARAARASRFGAATTTRSCSSAAREQVVRARRARRRRDGAAAPRAARSGFDVTTEASAQPRHRLDQRRVERRPGQAVADQPDAEWLAREPRAQTRPAACRCRRAIASITTAASSTAPVTMNFTDDSSPSRSIPFEIDVDHERAEQRVPDAAAAAEQAGARDHRAGDREQQQVAARPRTGSPPAAARRP